MPKKYTGPERKKGRESLFADFELLEHDTFKTSLLYQALLKGKKKIVLKQGRAIREVDLQQLRSFLKKRGFIFESGIIFYKDKRGFPLDVFEKALKDFSAEQTAKNPNIPKPKFKRNPRRN